MKQTLLIVLGFIIVSSSSAQKTTPSIMDNRYGGNINTFVVPREFAYKGKPLLSVFNYENEQISIYNENIDLVKTFSIDDNKTFDYSLTYQNETRDVIEVNKENATQESLGISFNEWCEEQQSMNPYMSLTEAFIIREENGDSIISIDYSKIKDFISYSNERIYFGYSQFGFKYPRLYWLASKGNMYKCSTSYTVTYSDWRITDQFELQFSEKLPHISLYNLNLDNGGGSIITNNGTCFLVSQTLFNQDEDYEYIVPKLSLVPKTNGGYDDIPIVGLEERKEDVETSKTTLLSDKSKIGLVGFKIVSSSGNVISELDFDDGFACEFSNDNTFALITIGGNRYLTISQGCGSTVFYKIDSQTSSIKKVNVSTGSLFVQPSVVNKNATINVSLGDGNANGSDIVLVSMSGSKVGSVFVPKGQKEARIHVNVPSGVYCISRIQQGKVGETKKIIVK